MLRHGDQRLLPSNFHLPLAGTMRYSSYLTLIDVDAQISEVLIKRRGRTLYRYVYEFLSFSYLPSINSVFTSCGKGFVFVPGVDTSVSRELL
jgi:hypothetical protein